MRILYHHRVASNDGQAVHIGEMIAALRELGHDVRVVAPHTADRPTMGQDLGWVHRMRAALPKFLYELLELGYSVLAYWRLRRAAREFRPDVLYERCNLYLVAGALLKRRLGIPMLLEVNAPLTDERLRFGGLALPWLARFSELYTWRSADFVLPVTQVLAGVVRAGRVPDDRIVVIANGINEQHFAGAPSQHSAKLRLGWSDALVLGFTGFVREWHGIDRVVRWMGSNSAPANTRLLVVGDGPARGDIERLAAELKIDARVRFTGVVRREEVPELVSAFDIAVQPAVTFYASPLKLFEYLAMGKAIIAPRQLNIEEVLQDGVNARLFNADLAGDFERQLTLLCREPKLRADLAAEAARTIERRGFTWRGNARRVVELALQLKRVP